MVRGLFKITYVFISSVVCVCSSCYPQLDQEQETHNASADNFLSHLNPSVALLYSVCLNIQTFPFAKNKDLPGILFLPHHL